MTPTRVGGAGTGRGELRQNEKRGVADARVEAVESQDVGTRQEEILERSQIEVFKLQRVRRPADGRGLRIPLHGLRRKTPRHFHSVECRDEAIVVLHAKSQEIDAVNIGDFERDTNISRRVLASHDFAEIRPDELRIRGAVLLVEAETTRTFDPGAVVKIHVGPVEPEVTVSRNETQAGRSRSDQQLFGEFLHQTIRYVGELGGVKRSVLPGHFTVRTHKRQILTASGQPEVAVERLGRIRDVFS